MALLLISIPTPLLCFNSFKIEKIIQPEPIPASKKNSFFLLKTEIIGSIRSSVSGLGINEFLSTKKLMLLNSLNFIM